MSSRLFRRGASAGVAALLLSILTGTTGSLPAAATSSLTVGPPIAYVEKSTGFLHVIGEVTNSGPDPAQFVHVGCTLYDSHNNPINKTPEVTPTEANILLNGDRSPFDDTFLTPSTFDHVGCNLAGGSSTTHVADHNLTATITSVSTDTSNVQHVSGTVVINPVPVDLLPDLGVKTMVTFRDSSNALIDEASVYINNQDPVVPGQAYAFTIDRQPEQPAWDGVIAHASTLTEAAAPVAIVPGPLAFGDQIQRTTSPSMMATIGNKGTGDLHVSNVGLTTGSDFAITSNSCLGFAVHPDATCAIGIAFTPTVAGARSDTLNFSDDADVAPHAVSLSGNGLTRVQISASPTAIDFGNQLVNTSVPKTFTVTSGGPDPVPAGHLTFTPNSGASPRLVFDESGCLTALPLAAGSSCIVKVTFTPTTAVMSSATLTVTATDSGNNPARGTPPAVNVTGTGVLGQGQLSLSVPALDFGNQTMSSPSAARPVTLTNVGTASMTVSLSLSGPASGDYSETDSCGTPLDPVSNPSCTVNVTLTPSALGTRTATLVITDTGVNNGSVALTGNGISAPTPTGGYWLVGSTGGIATFGDAVSFGSIGMALNKPIVGMAVTPDHKGYWLVASDGGIFTFGDAPFKGSTGSLRLNKPVVGMASTPSGQGYWLVASDGGIFTFGDAPFLGSTGSLRLNKPVVGMAPTRDGNGYWLVASDGGIFTFGNAPFKGSTGSLQLNQPVDGMAPTPSGQGYWLVASDGGIFTFGDAPFKGSSGGNASGIIGMGATASGQGYRMAGSAGNVLVFGDAADFGSLNGGDPRLPVAGMAAD